METLPLGPAAHSVDQRAHSACPRVNWTSGANPAGKSYSVILLQNNSSSSQSMAREGARFCLLYFEYHYANLLDITILRYLNDVLRNLGSPFLQSSSTTRTDLSFFGFCFSVDSTPLVRGKTGLSEGLLQTGDLPLVRKARIHENL